MHSARDSAGEWIWRRLVVCSRQDSRLHLPCSRVRRPVGEEALFNPLEHFGQFPPLGTSISDHAPVPACVLDLQSCDQQVRFSLAPCSGVRGPVGRAVFSVHSNPFQNFGQCSPHIGTGRKSDHAPDVATCILDVHKVRLACRILRQARSCDLHIGAKLRQDEGAANHTLQIVGRCC